MTGKTTRQHAVEIANYVFGKPEMACYKLLRETTDEEVLNLRAQIRGLEGFTQLSFRARITCPGATIAETVALFSLRRCFYLC